MIIEKYRFEESEKYPVEVLTTLTELYEEMPYLSKGTIKKWVLSGGREIFKKGKIKLYKQCK